MSRISFMDESYPDWVTWHDIDANWKKWTEKNGTRAMPLSTHMPGSSKMVVERVASGIYDASFYHLDTYFCGTWYSRIIRWWPDGTTVFLVDKNQGSRAQINRIEQFCPVHSFSVKGRKNFFMPTSERGFRSFEVGEHVGAEFEDGSFRLKMSNDGRFILGKFQCPFRIDPAWITPAYRRLVKSGAPMDVLADTLVANGCDNELLVTLLRSDRRGMTRRGLSLDKYSDGLIDEAGHRAISAALDERDGGEWSDQARGAGLHEVADDVCMALKDSADLKENNRKWVSYMQQMVRTKSKLVNFIQLRRSPQAWLCFSYGNYVQDDHQMPETDLGWPAGLETWTRLYYAVVHDKPRPDMSFNWIPFPRGIGPDYFRDLID